MDITCLLSLHLLLVGVTFLFIFLGSVLVPGGEGLVAQIREIVNMNHCAFQQTAFAACDEMRSSISMADRKDSLYCPKPRRLGLSNYDSVRPLRWHLSHQGEVCESKAGNELLDLIISKGGGNGVDHSLTQLASSPPFFCGSPPSRAANPLVHDARFGEEKPGPLSPVAVSGGMPSSPSAARKGCVRTKFGHKPAVRIEGFDCLDRDRRNCSIPAVA
ncbi:hypothetical protein H6P81_008918 [Aristolochia fimbriata]|uniref:Uncharacterized protein n=1 Tax=Aristolochia fimbriata TaxID=158543 RepID=A0AAV7ENX6_ARIFI|nr:hypothetical protein H6P81_008918 [Aristolochia fimbriata]